MDPQPNDRPHGTVFPSTRLSWIEEQLGQGRRAEVNRYLMSVYCEPLLRQVRRSGWRRLGTPEELVHGFFADRLAQPEFLRKWQHSDRRLRSWLSTAMSLFLKEQASSRKRDGRWRELSFEVADDDEPDRELDRDHALSFVRGALERARSELEQKGFGEYFAIFYEHRAEGVPYAELARRFGVSAERAQVMARTARKAFERAMRLIVGRDCGRNEDLDGEIDRLLEALDR